MSFSAFHDPLSLSISNEHQATTDMYIVFVGKHPVMLMTFCSTGFNRPAHLLNGGTLPFTTGQSTLPNMLVSVLLPPPAAGVVRELHGDIGGMSWNRRSRLHWLVCTNIARFAGHLNNLSRGKERRRVSYSSDLWIEEYATLELST